MYFNSHIKIRCVCRPVCDIVPFDRNNSESTLVRRVVCNQNNGRTKSPGGTASGARNTPNRGRRPWSAGVRKLEHEKGGQITLLFRASDGNRTRTDISAHGILSPACLPIPPPKLPLQAFRRPYRSFRPVCMIAKIVNIFVKTGKRF